MRRLRWAAALALVAMIAAAVFNVDTFRVGTGPAQPWREGPIHLATTLPAPTPTPVWADSVIAAAMAEGDTQSVVLTSYRGGDLPRRLAGGFERLGHLAWAPDGRRLAFAARRESNWDLYLVGRDGQNLQRLTTDAAFDDWPAWAPDGRSLAFVSYREGTLAVYVVAVDAGAEASATRLTSLETEAIEPVWSPDGRWVVYSEWYEGRYRLMAVEATGGEPRLVEAPPDDTDLRSPGFSTAGDTLSYVARTHGSGMLVRRPWSAAQITQMTGTVSMGFGVVDYAWFPGANAVVTMSQDRGGRQLDIRDLDTFGTRQIALSGVLGRGVSWAAGPMPQELASVSPSAGARLASALSPTAAEMPGLRTLDDVRVGGARINALIADDYAALRAEVKALVGRDFLGTLSDMWRPLGFKSQGSAFFSWHKTGRAFDTQMELRGPGGRRDLVLLREDVGGRTQWRMFLRAAAQDGSVGQPLEEPGWSFAAGSGDPSLTQAGGKRGGLIPAGYWVDFTALAERYGWRRIPSLTQAGLDWHRDWEAIEYWHFERRDGLSWYAAVRQVYDEAHVVSQLAPERLQALNISLGRLSRMGFPPGWPGEG